jgi:hypothetical protein
MITLPPVSMHTPLSTVEMLRGAVSRWVARGGSRAAGRRSGGARSAACYTPALRLTPPPSCPAAAPHLPRYSSTFWLNWLMDS